MIEWVGGGEGKEARIGKAHHDRNDHGGTKAKANANAKQPAERAGPPKAKATAKARLDRSQFELK